MGWGNREGKLTWAHPHPCPLIVAHVWLSLPMSACHCLCPRVVACICSHSWAVVFICECSPLLMGGRFRSCTVVFVHMQSLLFIGIHFCGWLPLFVGGGLCLWALVFAHGWLPSFMGGLAVGAVWSCLVIFIKKQPSASLYIQK